MCMQLNLIEKLCSYLIIRIDRSFYCDINNVASQTKLNWLSVDYVFWVHVRGGGESFLFFHACYTVDVFGMISMPIYIDVEPKKVNLAQLWNTAPAACCQGSSVFPEGLTKLLIFYWYTLQMFTSAQFGCRFAASFENYMAVRVASHGAFICRLG